MRRVYNQTRLQRTKNSSKKHSIVFTLQYTVICFSKVVSPHEHSCSLQKWNWRGYIWWTLSWVGASKSRSNWGQLLHVFFSWMLFRIYLNMSLTINHISVRWLSSNYWKQLIARLSELQNEKNGYSSNSVSSSWNENSWSMQLYTWFIWRVHRITWHWSNNSHIAIAKCFVVTCELWMHLRNFFRKIMS